LQQKARNVFTVARNFTQISLRNVSPKYSKVLNV